MKMKLLIGVLVFLILVNLVTIGSYMYFGYMRHPSLRPPPEMAGLTEGQHRKLSDLLNRFNEETQGLRDHARDIENETSKLLLEDPVQQDKIETKLKELSEVRLQISRKAVQQLLEAKSFLPPQQQKDFFNRLIQARPGPPPGGPPRNPEFDHMPPPDHPPEHD